MRYSILLIIALTFTLVLGAWAPLVGQAGVDIASKCNYESESGVNPDYQMVNCLLTEAALAKDIPPEIVKGIATVESHSWKQFDENGDPIMSADGGIGIMQITYYQDYDVNRLKEEIVYNIQVGVEMLDQMFARNDLPKINDASREVIEHWYFAVMAYNGIKPINSPVFQADGERNRDAYQEKVFQKIEKHNARDFLTDIPFERSDFDYDSSSRANIIFSTTDYVVEERLNVSQHQFVRGEDVFTNTSVNLRAEPTTESEKIAVLSEGENVTINGRFFYDQSEVVRENHFVWYPITRVDGTNGFIASSYLESRQLDRVSDENRWKNWSERIEVVDAEKIWNVEFNHRVITDSITRDPIYVKNNDGEVVDVRVRLRKNGDGKTVQVEPNEPYEAGQTYTLYVSSVIQSEERQELSLPIKLVFTIEK